MLTTGFEPRISGVGGNQSAICAATSLIVFFIKLGLSWPLFSLFSSLQYRFLMQLIVNNIANDWIRTSDLWSRKQPLYQLCHTTAPINSALLGTTSLFRRSSFADIFWPLLPSRLRIGLALVIALSRTGSSATIFFPPKMFTLRLRCIEIDLSPSVEWSLWFEPCTRVSMLCLGFLFPSNCPRLHPLC